MFISEDAYFPLSSPPSGPPSPSVFQLLDWPLLLPLVHSGVQPSPVSPSLSPASEG